MVEIAVQSTEGIGSAYEGSVNHRVIIGVGPHDAGSRAGEKQLLKRPLLEEAEAGYFFVREFR